MIWLSTVSLAAGGLLAQRFEIILVALATFVVVAIPVGIAQTRGVWSTIVLVMATGSTGIKIGYFVGISIQYGVGALRGPGWGKQLLDGPGRGQDE